MKKVFGIACLLAGACLLSSSVLAEEASDRSLSERVSALEEKPGGAISFSGLVEVEAAYTNFSPAGEGVEDEDASDLVLATVELGVDAEITEHVSGHVLFLYEDGEDLLVDEGYVLLDGGDAMPLHLKAGEIYVPFGRFESNMISDPLTLEIGETREAALEVGFSSGGFYGAAFLFNGDLDIEDDDNHLDNFGFAAGYAVEKENFNLDLGGSFINNIYESDGLSGMLEESYGEAEELGFSVSPADRVPGAAAYLVLSTGPFSLIGEYVAMLDDTEADLEEIVPGVLDAYGLPTSSTADGLEAFNLEVGYAFAPAWGETVLAAAWQGVKHAEEGFPENRYMFSVGIGILENTSLAFEYAHDEYETDDTGDTLTAQLAVEF